MVVGYVYSGVKHNVENIIKHIVKYDIAYVWPVSCSLLHPQVARIFPVNCLNNMLHWLVFDTLSLSEIFLHDIHLPLTLSTGNTQHFQTYLIS